MARISKTELIIDYMIKHGDPTARIIKCHTLNGEFFPDGGFIYRKGQNVNRRASTWEIKILFEEFIYKT